MFIISDIKPSFLKSFFQKSNADLHYFGLIKFAKVSGIENSNKLIFINDLIIFLHFGYFFLSLS